MDLFTHPEFDDHENVVFCRDPAGLEAIIAIHSTALGPAAGGCRLWHYPSHADALTDALRLSKAMSYKNALAGLPLGGGKSVVMAPAEDGKRDEVLGRFADHVQRLGGIYWTAEDVGVGPQQVAVLAEHTRFVFGTPAVTGDPSPATARGVFAGMKAAVRQQLDADLSDVRVAIQGIGNVGTYVARLLAETGAKLLVADIDPNRVDNAVQELGAEPVPVEDIHRAPADVLAPCALGGTLNASTIPELAARVVAGSANNQLADDAAGRMLHDRGVLYAPDYVVNAGGMLWASGEIDGVPWDREGALDRIDQIESTCAEVFSRSHSADEPPSSIADAMARSLLEAGT